MMLINKQLLTFTLSVCLTLALYGQQTGEIEGKKFIIEKNKLIILPEFERNFEKVPFNPPNPTPIEVEFMDLMPQVSTSPQSLSIRALMLKTEAISKLYPGHVRLGFGNYLSTLAEIGYANKRSEKWAWNTYIRHRAAARGPVKFASDSENRLGLQGSLFHNSGIYSASIDYSRYRYNMYGFAPELLPENDDTISRINQKIRGVVSHNYLNDKWTLDNSISFSNFNLIGGSNETLIDVQSNSGYKLSDQIKVLLTARLQQSTLSDTISANRNILDISPTVSYIRGKLSITGGFRFAYDADTVADNNGGHLYPRLHISYALHPQYAAIYASLDGRMELNSIQGNFQTLPFYADQQLPINSNRKSDIQIGIKGTLGSKFSYHGGMDYAVVQYLQTFVNAPLERSELLWIYDTKNSTVNRFFISSSVAFPNNLKVVVEANYYDYNMGELNQAWHLPQSVIKSDLIYSILDKVNLQAGLVLLSGIKARELDSLGNETSRALGIIPDVRMQADYSLSERFGVFLQINNLLAVNYQRFQFYPVRGFQAIGGLKFNF